MTTDPHLAGDPPGTWLKTLACHDLPRHSLAENHQARAQLRLHRAHVKQNPAVLITLLGLIFSVCIPVIHALWLMGKLETIVFVSFLLFIVTSSLRQSHDQSSDEDEDNSSVHQVQSDPLSPDSGEGSIQADLEEE